MVGAGPTDELQVTSEGDARKGRFRRLRRNRAERRPVLRRPKRGPLGVGPIGVRCAPRLCGAVGSPDVWPSEARRVNVTKEATHGVVSEREALGVDIAE